ncbi:MAG TPA: carbamoyltransferase N-terminal domain-containing protein, partial [Blastocatellia bacterium]|nr:carbamoyltransferase N-terminal domain-containing protein [Blastocatellia bacterium]
MNILGISGQERDAAAALVQDGRVVAAIEEEKLARIRHIGMNYAGGLPFRAIEFCLERAGIGFDKIDYVAYYLEPHKRFHREIAFNSSRAINAAEHGAIEGFPPYFVESLNDLKQRLRTRRLVESQVSAGGKFVEVPHHLAHGASAFFASGFERAAVISVDNKGDMTSAALMTGEGEQLRIQAEAQFPNSIGMVYGAVTAALGFNADGDWHKTMWLAPTGKPESADLFKELLCVDDNGLPAVNLDYFDPPLRGTPALSDHFFECAGLEPRAKDEPITEKHRNLAASVQARVEDVLCEIAIRHRERTGEENLCMA